jgi:hypothetical protein
MQCNAQFVLFAVQRALIVHSIIFAGPHGFARDAKGNYAPRAGRRKQLDGAFLTSNNADAIPLLASFITTPVQLHLSFFLNTFTITQNGVREP